MFFSKSDQSIIAFQQIRYNNIPVIITVNIKHPEYGIRFMLREHGHDRIVLSKKQNGGKRNSFLLCLLIRQNQSRAAKHLLIPHRMPWMASRPHAGHVPRPFQQVLPKRTDIEPCHFIHIIGAVFSGIQTKYLIRMIGNINIGFMVSVKNPSAAPADILRNRNPDIKNKLPFIFIFHRSQIKGRIHLIFIIDSGNKIFFHLIDMIRMNSQNFSVILHPKKDMSAIPVGKGADALIDIFCNVRGRFLKFHNMALSLFDELQ